MKKLLLLGLIAYGAYQSYQKGFPGFPSMGIFGNKHTSSVILFVGPGCGQHCDRIRDLLAERHVRFNEIDVAGPDGEPIPNQYEVNQFPVTMIGSRRILGDDMPLIFSVLAETYGKDVLTHSEQIAMTGHFDSKGQPRIVMYGASWCPICRQEKNFFEANNIEYENIDVEASEAGLQSYQILKGTGYPLTYVGYRRISGFNEQKIREAIKDLDL